MGDKNEPAELESLKKKIGENYDLLGLIAEGGMGAVYKARHIQLDRFVAIKVLTPKFISKGTESEFPVSERFEAEAKAMASLLHSNIVAVHDFGETGDGVHYIVMEFVDGEDIETHLENSDLAVENVLIIARQICNALIYSHEMGIVHRDIKPGNILIDRTGKAKVTDFGLVKVMGSNRFNTQIGFGTPGYYAPELEDGKSDQRSDIYSFGIMLYQMLTGQLPSGFWEPATVVRPELDKRFDDVIGKCLRRKPEDRYQSMSEVRADLDDIAFSTPDGKTGAETVDKKSLLKKLAWVYVSLFAVSIVVTLFDCYFNHYHLGGLLNQADPELHKQSIESPDIKSPKDLFLDKIQGWNLFCYLTIPLAWAWIVFSMLHKDPKEESTKRSVLNLPWWGAGLTALGWFISIPALFFLIKDLQVPTSVNILLPVSILVKSGISILLGFLVTDMVSQRLLYPFYFSRSERPLEISNRKNLFLETRGLFWMISSSVCPLLALLLLVLSINYFDASAFANYQNEGMTTLFAISVTLISIGFVVTGIFMFRYLVVLPVRELREAAISIREGDFDVQIGALRTDEFGDLAHEFNRMAAGLREREHLREMVDQKGAGKVAEDLSKKEKKKQK